MHRRFPDTEHCPQVLRQIGVVAVGVRDERGEGFGRFDLKLVVRNSSRGGLVASTTGILHYMA